MGCEPLVFAHFILCQRELCGHRPGSGSPHSHHTRALTAGAAAQDRPARRGKLTTHTRVHPVAGHTQSSGAVWGEASRPRIHGHVD